MEKSKISRRGSEIRGGQRQVQRISLGAKKGVQSNCSATSCDSAGVGSLGLRGVIWWGGRKYGSVNCFGKRKSCVVARIPSDKHNLGPSWSKTLARKNTLHLRGGNGSPCFIKGQGEEVASEVLHHQKRVSFSFGWVRSGRNPLRETPIKNY